MSRPDHEREFDAFYRGTARRVVHLVYGTTGDLSLAQEATQADHDLAPTPDDLLIRSALEGLGDDVHRMPLPEPAVVRATGDSRRRRRLVTLAAAAAAVVVAAGALAFSALRSDAARDLPRDLPGASVSVTPTAAAPRSPDAASGVSPGATPSSAPSSAQTSTSCGVGGSGVAVTQGISEAAAATARAIARDAADCDLAALIARAERDGTVVSLGGGTPREVFASARGAAAARTIGILLGLTPQSTQAGGETFTQWPAQPATDAQWAALVEAGLYTADEIAAMRDVGDGYAGSRIVIDATGRWTAFVAGD